MRVKEKKKEEPKAEEKEEKIEEVKEEETKKEETKKEETKKEETKEELVEVVKEITLQSIGTTPLDITLAEFMQQTLLNVLFLPGFTIPISQKEEGHELDEKKEKVYDKSIELELIWDGGIAVNNYNRTATNEQISNRVDALRCLIASFSSILYQKANEIANFDNKLLGLTVNKKNQHLGTLLFSLLNVLCNYDPTGSLPYSSQLLSDTYEEITQVSSHVLCNLLHYKREDNEFLAQLKGLKIEKDFEFIYNGITKLLNNVIHSHNTYLPNSQKMIEFYEEVLVVLWKLLDENKEFKIFISKQLDITKLLVPILFLIQNSKNDTTKFPMVQLACFILLSLSGSREFGVALNRPFDIKVPLDYPVFQGSFGELLILVLHKVIVSDKGFMRALFDCMLTIICNISPYLKTLSMVACSKLISLLDAFAAKRFLYSAEKNHSYVFLLLETINNLIQYQYEGCVHLVYSILRRKDIFIELTNTPKIEEINKLLSKKEEKKIEIDEKEEDKKDEKMGQDENKKEEKKKFKPTDEWIESWKPNLPLKTINTLIKIMVPEVEKLCSVSEVATEEDVLVYLKKTTLVGLLPVPHKIVIRTFQTNQQIDNFLSTYIWGLVYLRTLNPPLFDKDTIKLFTVNVVE